LIGSYAAKDGLTADEILARVKLERELDEWKILEAAGAVRDNER
jgi:hypothetical protein